MQKVFSCELRLVTSAFNRRICLPEADMQEKTSGTQGNHGGTIALRSQHTPPPLPQQHHHHSSEDSTLGDVYLKQ